MFLIDITQPAGALDRAAQQRIARLIIDRLLIPDAAPPATLGRARRMTHVVFREAQSWATGDGPLADDTATPYLVTITVPEAWRPEISSHAIAAVRAALADQDDRVGASRRGGDLWVNLIGVADGSIGLDGTATDATGVVSYMTEDHHGMPAPTTDLPEGIVLDPICGMRVRLGPDAITLEHDGQTVGFCATGCRDAYARNHDQSLGPRE